MVAVGVDTAQAVLVEIESRANALQQLPVIF